MIAICIGHSRKVRGRFDGGAYSPFLKRNEREFNIEVVNHLATMLASACIPHTVFDDYDGNGYGTAMEMLANRIKRAGCSHAIELHFNSATPTAHGHEWLYWRTSTKGKAMAQAFDEAFSEDYPHHKPRGIKAKTSGDRGSTFLKVTHCPAIILEPFFGSNEEDASAFGGYHGPSRLAATYATAIRKIYS